MSKTDNTICIVLLSLALFFGAIMCHGLCIFFGMLFIKCVESED